MITLIKPHFSVFTKLTLLLVLISGFSGCETLTQSTTQLQRRLRVTQITNLYPKRKVGAKVYVQGTITSHAPFIGAAAYKVEDSTGSVWVFTTETLPEIDEEILIRAQVEYESITLEEMKDIDIGDVYLQELERIPET
ncbi:MAG: hypothetical protein WBA13_06315 [Microcoleaceae cyanobacterium]